MIAFNVVEPDLSPERVDARLAAGWFPYGPYWMTCRLWPATPGAAVDTVWLRVRLRVGRPGGRLRRLMRDGMTVHWLDRPRLDDEHQALFESFRTTHPDWRRGPVGGLLLHDSDGGVLLERTREAALRDRQGRLIAFRWYVEGRDAIAGVTSIYDPSISGLGGVARWVVDQHAAEQGLAWSYPGYVRPGAPEPWLYKVKPGRSEWLDPGGLRWRSWDERPPDPAELDLARMRERLTPVGTVLEYPRWAAPWFDGSNRELPFPLYVTVGEQEQAQVVVTWDAVARRYRSLLVEPVEVEGAAALQVIGLAQPAPGDVAPP